ncbi:oligosaccharide flippase family protein [Allomuricauda sp. M10]|uniref:oligosaccharide flippase family protein n=1 Tax=Allomuricauda sp. M10 TaxID=2683292 RepID=UPI001D186976|nr:oligosaccharide flippase family protein [Muricauda sp. M10]
MAVFSIVKKRVSPQQLFMLSALLVNGGNYIYNLLLGRILGPEAFADAALLVTLLLVLSFLGMTFQLVTAKFVAALPSKQWDSFRNRIGVFALVMGCILGGVVFFAAPFLQNMLQTENALMFRIFGIGVPFYFVMSVNRGQYQGEESFAKLSISYQSEMWGRLLITLLAFFIVRDHFGVLVSFGILGSLALGLVPFKKLRLHVDRTKSTDLEWNKVRAFMLITACYELTQIIINNSDIILVKHFFQAQEAGLYASLALIGRVVYFVAWMFVMLLLPTVVRLKKEGEPTGHILFKYVGYIGLLSSVIVVVCALFPELIITLLFGDAYLSMASLLWQYALATSLFAVANIFTYYFLSLDQYRPIWFSAILGVSQIVLIAFFHSSLAQVVQLQILVMLVLLAAQIGYFLSNRR